MYSSSVDKTHNSTAEISSILLVNPVGSGKYMLVDSFIFSTVSPTLTAVAKVYLNPTVTSNGNLFTIANNEVGGPASVMKVYGGPAVSNVGQKFCTYVVSTAGLTTLIVKLDSTLYMSAGNAVLITITHDVSTSKTTNTTIRWEEQY